MDGILLINKPAGCTSHDIVGIVRKKLHTKVQRNLLQQSVRKES
mgnify:CR=1 FL=1